MLLKHFLLSTLLAINSVTALPNPITENYGIEARDHELTRRIVICGRQESGQKGGECECPEGQKKSEKG
ncbi:hypothetical protein FOTG_18914, partial [Fusarium oxysporum f. sp. vasinfectum 25433]